jgi:uncharacterized protein YjbK
MGDATDGRERELKLRVPGRAALDAVRRAAGGDAAPAQRQRNHFFDTAGRDLARARLALRLREEGRRAFVTAKGPVEASAGAFTARAEDEVEVDADTAQRILAGALSPLVPLAGRPLAAAIARAAAGKPIGCFGSFANERTRVPWRIDTGSGRVDAVLELDETAFPGERVEHEVELEIPPDVDPAAAERALRALLARAGVAGEPAPPKLERFLASLGEA